MDRMTEKKNKKYRELEGRMDRMTEKKQEI